MREGRREEWRRGSGSQPSITPSLLVIAREAKSPYICSRNDREKFRTQPRNRAEDAETCEYGVSRNDCKRSETFRS